ncbi:MAG: hypothetical protein KA210_12430 [Bacteroidia bacterium]|nr:hypothetical protein [Bacteroidia bacterium]
MYLCINNKYKLMGKKSRELEVLNDRRIALINNLDAFVDERNRLQQKINNMIDHIDAANMEIAAIDIQLSSIAVNENFEVKLHTVHGEHETNNPKLMVEIIIEDHPPIYKLLNQYDLMIYSSSTNKTDKLQLKSRVIEVVKDWLSKDISISRLFSDEDEKLNNALENYVTDNLFERKIRRAASFFPIIDQD